MNLIKYLLKEDEAKGQGRDLKVDMSDTYMAEPHETGLRLTMG